MRWIGHLEAVAPAIFVERCQCNHIPNCEGVFEIVWCLVCRVCSHDSVYAWDIRIISFCEWVRLRMGLALRLLLLLRLRLRLWVYLDIFYWRNRFYLSFCRRLHSSF